MSARPHLVCIAGRPVSLPRDLKRYRAPRPAHAALAAAATLRLLATVALVGLAGWLMVAALFALDTTPQAAANDPDYRAAPH